MSRNSTAILALTRPAIPHAARLAQAMPEATFYAPGRYLADAGASAAGYGEPLGDWLRETYRSHDSWVCFAAIGAIVRMLAPVLGEKTTDPAVVVVDAAARFSVSVLAGHTGGGNRLACEVAEILGAQPVITTASDSLGTIAVDLLGRDLGWNIAPNSDVTAVSACVVNGEPVAVLQEAGERGWHPQGESLPGGLERVSKRSGITERFAAALVITDNLAPDGELAMPHVVYRPKTLVVGIGCRRGVSIHEIEEAVRSTFARAGLAFESIRAIATAERKRDESGLSDFAASRGVPIRYYQASELASIDTPNPSERVLRELGTASVCEAAALLASGANALVVEKSRFSSVTVAVARIEGQ